MTRSNPVFGRYRLGGDGHVPSSAELFLLAALLAGPAAASDACSTRAVVSSADVTVSDGSTFSTDAWFHSRNAAAIRLRTGNDQVVAIEGPLGWIRDGDEVSAGARFLKPFALGHQHHALLLYFDDIVDSPRPNPAIELDGETRSGRSGDYPYGGTAHLVDGDGRVDALILEFPDSPPIVHAFRDWRRTAEDVELPHRIVIDDGRMTFEYDYSTIEIAPRSPLWFMDTLETPGLAEVDVYRLHRRLLAAHCLGDAALIAELSLPEVTVASGGELVSSTAGEMRERFTALFERLDYSSYVDLQEPVIRVSGAGDIGWIAVSVRAAGRDRASDAPFDDRWAWVMMARNDDGTWRHAGNAPNRAR